MKHATTLGSYQTALDPSSEGHNIYIGRKAAADDPQMPDDGHSEWRLVGCAAADEMLFWFWEREDDR